MPQLTPHQQHDLYLWKDNQNQPLPASLENLLIEDCLEELENPETRILFNSLSHIDFITGQIKKYGFGNGCRSFESLYSNEQKLIIQNLLSRIDGQAVMPFLDVEAYKTLSYPIELKTLDHLLYREFTEALRVGKSFDEALQIITKLYILHFATIRQQRRREQRTF